MTKISDHLPCFTVIKTENFTKMTPKFIMVNSNSQEAIESFKLKLSLKLTATHFDPELIQDPNVNYEKLHTVIIECKNKYLPAKRVRTNIKFLPG